MTDEQELLRESANSMVMLEAWMSLESHITNKINLLKRDLLSCKLEVVEVKRAEIRALESVLNRVKEMQNPIEL